MPANPQINIRVSDSARKLLKLMAFIYDQTEAQVVESALLSKALNVLARYPTKYRASREWEDEEEKLALLIAAVSRMTGLEFREKTQNEGEGFAVRRRAQQWNDVEDYLGELEMDFGPEIEDLEDLDPDDEDKET